ncbi:hypothetical protein Egran_06058 [Elaphomyces granulatus]|uniref:MFS maltose permease n=1 Tax=Elaphomyces granulatus TaxID=519963 RepID=A0A232LQ23_9EURO|nr:hypothetical protein Egran_06058 [Elaphomyces granulatus]
MLASRSIFRRIPGLLRPLRPPCRQHLPFSPRPFTNRSQLLLISPPLHRPQLPFLAPLAGKHPLLPLRTHLKQHFARLISTERRNYYKRGITLGLKIGVSIYLILWMVHLMKTGWYQEEIEHKWPTPPEWTWRSRWCLRSAEALQHPQQIGKLLTPWVSVSRYMHELIERLEDTEGDGKGIVEQGDSGFLSEGIGKTGFDISMKSESWRRGYFQALMSAAKAAENLEGWVIDWKERVSGPAEYVVGPSNPRPKPLPPRCKKVMREEDCQPVTHSPEVFYMKILATKGLNTKQKIDAALAYADWLGFKSLNATAKEVYTRAMHIAADFAATKVVDTKTGVLRHNNMEIPSENVLRVSTAFAVHHARMGELSTALSIFTSILKTRRGLPLTPSNSNTVELDSHKQKISPFHELIDRIQYVFSPVVYPDPPSDGNDPPVRTSASTCEEAALMTYIGEIVYASSSKENGLAWTRDAVDMAETALEGLDGQDVYSADTERCIQCLKVGLDNWKNMVRQLVIMSEKEELESIESVKTSWYGGEKRAQAKSLERKRWQAEEMIVEDRASRLHFVDDGLLGAFAPGASWFV